MTRYMLGNVAEIQNFPTCHQDLSMEKPTTREKESASTYPCRSLSGSVQVNGVDGVVLAVIQITDDPSAERTTPPRSTHVQPGDVSHALIQQGERERLRKTPSNSSTTAWWWWRSVAIPQGFAKHYGGEGGVGEGEGGARAEVLLPSLPPNIYRRPKGAGAPALTPPPREGCGQEGIPSPQRHL